MDAKTLFEKAYLKALNYLSYRPRSEKEISDYLLKKKFEEVIIQNVITLLKEQKFLNDREFSNFWIRTRQRDRSKSKRVIKYELLTKGIDKEKIDEFLENAEDDFRIAQEYFEKRKHRFKNMEKDEYFRKASGLLARRGFSWDIIKKVIERKDD